MKVLHVIPSLSPLRGGPSFALPPLAAAQARLGASVDVAATDDDGPGRKHYPSGFEIERDGVTYRYFARQTSFYSFSAPMTKWLWRYLPSYDLVHIHSVFNYPATATALMARLRQVPYIVRPLGVLDRWGMDNRRKTLKWASFRLVEGPILNRAAMVHYTSDHERLEAESTGVGAPGIVIPLGIDLDPFDSLGGPGWDPSGPAPLTSRPYVLYLSRIDRKKGIDLLIEAFGRTAAQSPHLDLVIAGRGDEELERELKAQVSILGLVDRIIFPGFLEGEIKLAALARAEMFVLPSQSENFGVAVVEAMAVGTPVVVTDRVGLARDVEERGAGMVTGYDVGHLAAAIKCLDSDAALRTQMGDAGRVLVRDRFSVQATAGKLLDAYGTVVHRTVKAPA